MFIHPYLFLIPFLLLIAAIFAASEAGLLSLSRTQLESIKLSRPSLHRLILKLLKKPEALLSTLIIGNECLNILIGTFVVTVLQEEFTLLTPTLLALTAMLVSSVLLLIFSEILPKVLAFRMPVLTVTLLVWPATWAHWLLTPFRKIFLSVSGEILKLFNIPPALPSALSEKDLLALVDVGEESGSLDRDEKQMIVNVFHFSDLTIRSVMTPWEQVFKLPHDISVNEVLSRVRMKTFSRVPVVSKTEDAVVGVLYTKELLKLLLESGESTDTAALKKAIFAPYIVSSHKKISRLFREFKMKKVHIALVVDEYGKNIGVVTLEDILNSLFQTHKKAEGVQS